MKKIILLLLLISSNLLANDWEILNGLDLFRSPYTVGDTLYGLLGYSTLANYKNKKWEKYDIKSFLFESIQDSTKKANIKKISPPINNMFVDKNNKQWFLLGKQNVYFTSYIFSYDGTNVEFYDSYLQKDSANETILGNLCYLAFDNNNVPYISVKSKYSENNYICKLENNKFKEINQHSTYYVTCKGIYFDSKNNFWEIINDSIYYYINDKVSKGFRVADFPKTDGVMGGILTKLCIDKNDKVYAITNILGLYVYDDEKWSLDTLLNTYICATTPAFTDNKNFNNIYLDSKDNLWAHVTLPFLFKRDKLGNWTKYLIPCTNTTVDFGASSFDYIYLGNKDRIWLYSFYEGNFLVFTPTIGKK